MSICDNICGDGALPSFPNDIKILLVKFKKEVDELIKTTEAKLLCQDGQIAEACQYLKNNLSNSIRCLLADMEASGELDKIITDAVLVEYGIMEVKLKDFVNVKVYGAVGNGKSRKLKDSFISLYEAQQIYPNATSLENEIDGLAIQKAINENPDKTIFVPDGKYIINTPIKIGYNQKFVGMSINDTVLNYTSDVGSLIDIAGKNHIDIENFTLLHDFEVEKKGVSNNAKAINSIACPYTRYKNLIIKGFDYGIDCSNNSWCSDFENITIQSCNNGVLANGEFNNCSFIKFRATYCKIGAYIGSGRTVSFTDSQFELNEEGLIKINLGDFVVRSSYFERNKKDIQVKWGQSTAYKVSIVDCSFFKNEDNYDLEPAVFCHGDENTLIVIKNCSFTKYNIDNAYVIGGQDGTKAKILLENNYYIAGFEMLKSGVAFANLVTIDSFESNSAYKSYKHSHTPAYVEAKENKVYLDGLKDSYRTFCSNNSEIYLPEKNENGNSFDIIVSLSPGKSVTVKPHPNSKDTINNSFTYTNETDATKYIMGKIIFFVKQKDYNEYCLIWY